MNVKPQNHVNFEINSKRRNNTSANHKCDNIMRKKGEMMKTNHLNHYTGRIDTKDHIIKPVHGTVSLCVNLAVGKVAQLVTTVWLLCMRSRSRQALLTFPSLNSREISRISK